MRKLSRKLGQSVIEYVLIMTVFLAAILAVSFIGRMRGAFGAYFTQATETMTRTAN